MSRDNVNGKEPPNGNGRKVQALANCKKCKLDPVKTRALREAGLSIGDIARHQAVNPSTVWRFLVQLDQEMGNLERFKIKRGDLLAHVQGKAMRVQHLALDSMEKDLEEDGIVRKLRPSAKKMYLDAATISGGVAFDKERLETGKSTANISTLSRMLDRTIDQAYKPQVVEKTTPSPSEERCTGRE